MPIHHTRKHLAIVTLMLMTLLFPYTSQANPNDALQVLKTAADEMFTGLNKDRAKLNGNKKAVRALVEKSLLPHIDIITSSKWVLGKHWRRADKSQKIEFIKQFRELLLSFYSSALAEYLNETTRKSFDPNMLKFQPIRARDDDTEVTVRSELIPESGKPLPIHFHMHSTKKGWKVYDVSVEGISVVTTYRTSFGTEIQQKGLDSLIASLSDKNNKFLAKAESSGKSK
ncbi:MAG: ABC transporter substrate-binding protein [Gammaproteobacteria bacterium]|nr:ABC transporter substrate-binding protein [Gammaproteobacteria bacterium]MDH5778049.1 ABC transporter substrate-binding protein [Gammaproteobacteria bacterium]